MGFGQRKPRDPEVAMRNSLTFAISAATLAVLAGCGSSGTKSTSSSTAAVATGTTSSAAAPSQPAGGKYAAGGSAAGAAGAGAGGMVVSTKHGALGTVLAAGPTRRTVYLFEGDRGSSSACAGACAGVWPPVTTSGPATAAAGALASDLGTIARPDGTKQVTYKGHPLYFFATDKDRSDSYGQGVKSFGSGWYVLAPSGNKIDKS
jgi:predicted lipoprotein with Yx(FWY)xxD motif